jgi:hypothetical protein
MTITFNIYFCVIIVKARAERNIAGGAGKDPTQVGAERHEMGFVVAL